MKINQLATIMKYSPLVYMGYIFKINQPGIGIVEETKKIAADIWKQKFVYIDMAQSDMYDVYLMKVQYKDEPVTFFFDSMERITEEMRNDIMVQFSINRDENINDKSHVIYCSHENTEFYQADEWNDYILCHGMTLNIEP